MWGRGALLAAVGGAWLLLGQLPCAAAELYQWTDKDGVVRYTPDPDRVPASASDTLQAVESQTPPRERNGAPLRPGALPAVMGSELPEELLGPVVEPGEASELDRRIETLRQAIERDRKALRDLVGQERQGDPDWELEVETLANRLPALQAELAELEEQRRQNEAAPGGAR